MASTRQAAARLLHASGSAARATRTLARGPLPPDVDPSTGLCASGLVRIAEAAGKGLGAFAARTLEPRSELGQYRGELLTLQAYRARYGDTEGETWRRRTADAEWHGQWSAERRCRGIGTTGQYVFKLAGNEPMFLDAEDPAEANWTRYINHSADPNLAAVRGATSVRFVVQQRPIAPGTELTFSYGPGFARWIERYCRPRPEALDEDWQRWSG